MRYEQQAPDASAENGGVNHANGKVPAGRRRKLWRNLGFGLLALAVIGTLLSVGARYATFDTSESRLSVHQHPLYFPVLMVHIIGSSIALGTCVLQVWPGLRRTRPRVHRLSGRLYVFAGVLPAGIGVLVLTAFWPYSPLTGFSDVLSAILWLAITGFGWRLARQRRYADHRRWMLRSFALTVSILAGTVFIMPIGWVVQPEQNSLFAGSHDVMLQVWSGINVWMGWIIPLLAVEFWLERDVLRRSAPKKARPVPAERSLEPVAEVAALAETSP